MCCLKKVTFAILTIQLWIHGHSHSIRAHLADFCHFCFLGLQICSKLANELAEYKHQADKHAAEHQVLKQAKNRTIQQNSLLEEEIQSLNMQVSTLKEVNSARNFSEFSCCGLFDFPSTLNTHLTFSTDNAACEKRTQKRSGTDGETVFSCEGDIWAASLCEVNQLWHKRVWNKDVFKRNEKPN